MAMEADEVDLQSLCLEDKILTEEEKTKLEADVNLVSDFKRERLENEALKNWDLFYKRNTTKFFKDRHWTTREFKELTTDPNQENGGKRVYFEVGCGVGNFMFPLIREDEHCFFYACDFSPRAVDFIKKSPSFDDRRVKAFQCDITNDDITANVPCSSINVATLIFVLSAIHPDKMVKAVENIAQTLNPGGVLLVRDYGLYDHAMLRFSKGHKLSDNFYVRQDGTRAFYFSLATLEEIMTAAGLVKSQCHFVRRSTVNKKEGIDVSRIFIQGKFIKPKLSIGVEADSSSHTESNSKMDSVNVDNCS